MIALQPESPQVAEQREKKQRTKLTTSLIIGSIIVHVIGGIIAAIWIVAQYFAPPPATFEVKRDIRLPAQEREHRMNMAQYEALMPKPSFSEKLASMRPTDFALPDLPKMPVDQIMPLDPTAMVSDQVDAIIGTAGMGAAGAGAGGVGGTGTGMSFFGIEAHGIRIMLLFDVSGSVVTKAEKSGTPMSKIREETIKLIEGFGINTRFNIIQFVRNYKPFRPDMIPATDPNKEAARKWVQEEWSEAGTMPPRGRGVEAPRPNGIEAVLEAAFKMEPDTIFIISDGGFFRDPGNERVPYSDIRKTIDALQGESTTEATINFIGFEMRREDRLEMSRIIRRFNGQLREM